MGRIRYTFDDLAKVVEGLTEKIGLTKQARNVQDTAGPIGVCRAASYPVCLIQL